MNRPWIPLVAALVLAAACTQEAGGPAAAAPPTPVRTAPVETVELAGSVRSVGTLEPETEIRLSFKVGGVVERVGVHAGDTVARGQLLATIRRAEVDTAVAQAAEAEAKAKRDLERARRLREDEVATEEQVQDLATAWNVARANLESARFNARYARIEAPQDGVVLSRLAEPDELVQAGQPVLVLGGTDGGWIVRTALADRDAVRVEPGDTARVSFDAFPGREFAGRVTRVGSSADPYTGTFDVEVAVAPDGARFARGLVAKVVLDVGEPGAPSTGTVVPVAAIVEAAGSAATVFVLDPAGKVARRREVRVGPVVGESVVVTAGLAAGEQVITDGAAWLTDGERVEPAGQAG
ncbi:MAG: efflux RND transporter periplasmic adaptor subunit [Steroidobacteraceae bacterium]